MSINSTVAVCDPESAVQQTIKAAQMHTDQKFSTITDVSIQFRVNGPWYKVDVNMIELMQILQTAEFDEQKLTAVKIFEVQTNNEDMDVVHFIYDFVNLHTEKNPWRMV